MYLKNLHYEMHILIDIFNFENAHNKNIIE